MKGSIGNGIKYFLRGMSLLRHRKVLPFVILPLLVNIAVFGGLIYSVFSLLGPAVGDWLAALPDWLLWLNWVIWSLLLVATGLLTGYSFTFVAVLIAAPFNGLLAEKAEEIITGREVVGRESIIRALTDFPRAAGRELAKLAHYLPRLLGVLALSWIPPVSAVAPALWLLFGAWMMAIQYVDYPMDNHRIAFGELRWRLRQRWRSSLGFGGTVALASGIPLLNCFAMPAAVCGATVFWCEELKESGVAGTNQA